MKISYVINSLEFIQPKPLPQGMSYPYWVKEIKNTAPDLCRIELHSGEFFYLISDYVCIPPLDSPGLKTKIEKIDFVSILDWKPIEIWCDQTGGMCMVDVIKFDNGIVCSINDECILLWRNIEHYRSEEIDNYLFYGDLL